MLLLSRVTWKSTARCATLVTIAACIVVYTVVYLHVGDRPGVPWKPAILRMKNFSVNVNNSQNGGHHFDSTGTSRPAIDEQEKRITVFNEYCRKKPQSGFHSQKYRHHLIVIDKTKTIYCYIPKTGCTTTKLVMYNLQHDTNVSIADNKRIQIHRYPFKLLNSYSMEDAAMRLKTYNKLIVVRDPLERLASAWLEKFVHSKLPFSYIRTLQQEVWKSKVENTTTNKSLRGDLPPVSFRDFIWSIINNKYRDVHWEPFFSLCAPCQVQYDYIAHTDTLVEDLRLFFHRSGIVGKDGILPRQHPSRAKANFGNTFQEVPTEDIFRIGEIYKPDFEMFGYSFDQDLEMIEKERPNTLKQNA